MSERQFKHIETKIKQAADNLQPEFQEYAWDRMEALLDKDRRKIRPVYWWWLSLLIFFISVIIFYIVTTFSSINKKVVNKDMPDPSESKTFVATNHGSIQKPGVVSPSLNVKIENDEDKKKDPPNLSLTNKGEKPAQTGLDKTNLSINKIENNLNEKREYVTKVINQTHPEVNLLYNGDNTKDKISETKPLLNLTDKKKDDSLSENNTIPLHKEASSQNKSSFLSNLYITGTIGAEAPGLKAFPVSGSKISTIYGAGLGYQINKKFSLETGFYFGSKKYVTGPENYKYPEDSYWNTVELTQVDADCYIYEIPLLIRYNFLEEKSLLLSVSGGLESFIMKKEDYIFDYIKNGTQYTSARSYEGNRHFLSSLQLSIGLEKKINHTFSFLVIPSISIPISGVGNGKVKLHYTSIQAGVKLFPFQKK